ncbi:hypothetical protein DPMN_140012 [Dreissena polymorpha]|uniref:F5/8 type C domain-containing protein n=1 Tax=Dreissena polymorpha TaxID=45954 RepID=A0A9D4GA25_DREPO|nr:hypothetical protein DPMN_140012 [Dreissena polymorpha]
MARSSSESPSTFKQAEQSSTHHWPAGLAVEGDPRSSYQYCSHTNDQPGEWWMVDLGRVFQVGIAKLSWEECGRFLGPADGVLNITTTCNRTMHGRYVRIRKIKQDY